MRIFKAIVSCFIFLGLSGFAFADTITIRADYWYPYNGTPGAELPGYGIEIAEYIFSKAGHKIDYQNLNWSRTCKEVLKGTYDIAIGAGYGDLEGGIFPDEEIGIMLNTFFTLKDKNWQYAGVKSLENIKVGIIQDYSYDDDLDKYFSEVKDHNKVQTVAGDNALRNNIKKLLASRIDALIEDKSVFYAKAKEMNVLDKIKSAGSVKLKKSSYLFLGLSPKNPKSKEYAKLIDEGIREMRKNGKLKEILSKYGLSDWK